MLIFRVAVCLLYSVLAVGCAVTEPDDRDTARVRAALADDARVSIADLASDLGVSEVAVVRAMPESMRVALPTDDIPATVGELCEVAPVEIQLVGLDGSSATSTLSRVVLASFSETGVVLQSADGALIFRLRSAVIASIYLLRRGFDVEDAVDRSIVFYGSGGELLMAWHATKDPGSVAAFDRLWSRHEN